MKYADIYLMLFIFVSMELFTIFAFVDEPWQAYLIPLMVFIPILGFIGVKR